MTHKIILDTDPGVDDAMALLLALRSPELELLGLTSIFGNSTVEVTTRNALNLLHIAGRADIPVARGADVPLAMPLGETGEWVHGADAMGNIGWSGTLQPNHAPVTKTAAEFIVDTVMAHPGEVTLVPIGPLTNIARAMQLEPRIVSRVRQVTMMGGAVLSPGNVSPLAEANIANDPHAARMVLTAAWPVAMAGLDVTESIHVDNTLWLPFAQSQDPFARFIAHVAGFYQEFHRKWYGMQNKAIFMHDPCAIAYLIDPTLFECKPYALEVALDGPAAGATIADRRGKFYKTPQVSCMLRADEPRLLDLFRSRLMQS